MNIIKPEKLRKRLKRFHARYQIVQMTLNDIKWHPNSEATGTDKESNQFSNDDRNVLVKTNTLIRQFMLPKLKMLLQKCCKTKIIIKTSYVDGRTLLHTYLSGLWFITGLALVSLISIVKFSEDSIIVFLRAYHFLTS